MKIKELQLYTDSLKAQKQFYTELFNFELLHEGSDHLSISIGNSVLTFLESDTPMYYHFAVNIPYVQFEEALSWTSDRVKLLPMHGSEIIDFPNWKAKAFYFYDAQKNIVEFIARKDVPANASQPFTEKALLHISEVGLPTADVQQTFEQIEKYFGLEKYDGDFERFCAIGDETGLFITVNYEHKKWIPNMDAVIPFPFRLTFENNTGRVFEVSYQDEKLHLLNCS